SGSEKALNRCVPGGKDTARMVKEVLELADAAPVPASVAAPAASPAPVSTTGQNFALARLDAAAPLNRAPSAKDTRQVVFDIAGTGLVYEPGDALGVQPVNCPDTVRAIIDCLGAKEDSAVAGPDGVTRGLFDVLMMACEIGRPSDEAVEVL